jgi:hypothetical protein
MLSAEASERLVGSPVFKTGVRANPCRRVRFPSASAITSMYFRCSRERRLTKLGTPRTGIEPVPAQGSGHPYLWAVPPSICASRAASAPTTRSVRSADASLVIGGRMVTRRPALWPDPDPLRWTPGSESCVLRGGADSDSRRATVVRLIPSRRATADLELPEPYRRRARLHSASPYIRFPLSTTDAPSPATRPDGSPGWRAAGRPAHMRGPRNAGAR